jgi:hypothetical protein
VFETQNNLRRHNIQLLTTEGSLNAADTSKQLLAQAMKARQTAAAREKAKPKTTPSSQKKKADQTSSLSNSTVVQDVKKETYPPSKLLDQSLLEESTAVMNQYDPMRPNDFEEYIQAGGHKWLKKPDTTKPSGWCFSFSNVFFFFFFGSIVFS